MTRPGTAGRPDVVGAAADDLYGLPLDKFTVARGERAKQARADGDGDAAMAIGKLAKPSKVAWLANQLARDRPDEIRPLLELGDSMRRATASLDAERLRRDSRQQHQIISALLQQARILADAAGQAMSDAAARGLEETLHAALADEQAARQLSQGRLTSGLSRSGFPGIDASTAPAVAGPAAEGKRAQRGSRTGADQPAARREQLDRARQDEQDARSDAADADRTRQNAQATLTQAHDAAGEAAADVGRLRTELDAALEAQASAGRAVRQARKDADRADRAARHAERRLRDATARRAAMER
jgi:hypothetical protein